MEVIVVVVDCDWFTIDKVKYLKKIAFACSSLKYFREISFSLPPTAKRYACQLNREALHSHGLVWSTKGDYGNDQIPQAFADLFEQLGLRPAQIQFLAKGLEKCRLLQNWVPTVENLDDYCCPKYEALSTLDKTTLSKAIAFALWYDTWLHSFK